jgi:hypothetical protein
MGTTLDSRQPLSSMYTYAYDDDDKKLAEPYSKTSGSFFYGYGSECVAYREDSVLSNEVIDVPKEEPKPKPSDNFLIDFYWNEKFQVSLRRLKEININFRSFCWNVPSRHLKRREVTIYNATPNLTKLQKIDTARSSISLKSLLKLPNRL